MKVVITEKPSVARDIAQVLKITGKQKGYIEGRGCAITWAFGHLVTLLDPGEYDPELRKWRLDSLPFIPDEFKLKLIENRGVAEQFETIKRLCQEADEIVCLSPQAYFGGISMFYADFHQLGDEEVVDLLNRAADFLEEEVALPTP